MRWREYRPHIPNAYWTFENANPLEPNRDGFNEAIDWCRDQFGDDERRWWISGLMISIKRQSDATAFKVRWC